MYNPNSANIPLHDKTKLLYYNTERELYSPIHTITQFYKYYRKKVDGNLRAVNACSTCATISKCSKFFCSALAFCNDLPTAVFLLRKTEP